MLSSTSPQLDSVPMLNAVVEATRMQQTQQAQYETALAALRVDKEHTLMAFTDQLAEAKKVQAHTVAAMEADLGEVKQQLEESVNANGLLLNQVRTGTEDKKQLERDMKQHFDVEMKKMLASFELHVEHIQKLQIHILELEHWNAIQKRCWSQTGERCQLALTATHDRGMITLMETRKLLEQSQRQLNHTTSENQKLVHELASAQQAFETEKKLLTQRVSWLEQGMSDERGRAESAQTQLIASKDSLQTATHETAQALANGKVEMDQLSRTVKSLTVEVQTLQATAKAEAAEKSRLQQGFSEIVAQKGQLATELEHAKDGVAMTSTIAKEAEARLVAQEALITERLNKEIEILQHSLKEGAVQQQKIAAETKQAMYDYNREAEITKTNFSQQMDDLQKSNVSLAEHVTTLQGKLDAASSESDLRSAELHTLRDEVLPRMEAEKEQLQKENASALAKVNPLSEDLQMYKNKANALASSIIQLQSANSDAIMADLRTRAGSATELAQQLESSKAQVASLQAERNKLQEANQSQTDLIASLGDQRSICSQLSLRTLEVKDLKEELKALKQDMVTIGAKCMTAETRLHHSVQEGANTSLLLGRGLQRVQESAMMQNEMNETKQTLIRGARALRKCLEDEGYSPAALPVKPTESLDNNYLQEVLLDHVQTCTDHFKNDTSKYMQGGGQSINLSAVPTALRTPMVYRSSSKHLNNSGILE